MYNKHKKIYVLTYSYPLSFFLSFFLLSLSFYSFLFFSLPFSFSFCHNYLSSIRFCQHIWMGLLSPFFCFWVEHFLSEGVHMHPVHPPCIHVCTWVTSKVWPLSAINRIPPRRGGGGLWCLRQRWIARNFRIWNVAALAAVRLESINNKNSCFLLMSQSSVP